MDPALFSLFFVTTFLMALSPGPAVFLIMSQGMKFGPKGAMLGAVGIEIMNGTYFTLSAFGLTAALLAYPLLFQILKWSGIVYLLYNGIKILITAKERPLQLNTTVDHKKLIGQGIMTQLSNPKAVIYFGAMLPQFVNLNKPLGFQMSVLGIIGCTMEFVILSIYGFMAFKGSQYLPGPKAVLWQDRIAGLCLVLVAILLIFK